MCGYVYVLGKRFSIAVPWSVISKQLYFLYCPQVGSLAKQGLHELEAVITNAQSLGLNIPVSYI